MGSFSIWHWLLVGAVLLVVFGGRGKISDMMGDVAKGIKAFKKGMSDNDDDKSDPPKIDPPKTDPVKTVDHQAADPAASGKKSQDEAAKSRADA